MLEKRKLEQQGVMPLPKKSVVQATVSLTEYSGVLNRTTKPESTGKIVFACGTMRCQDVRVSRLNTFLRFLQPSAVTAAYTGSGKSRTFIAGAIRHLFPVRCIDLDSSVGGIQACTNSQT
jgi:hypothetical protein